MIYSFGVSRIRPQKEDCLNNEDDLKNEDNIRNEDDLNNEDDYKKKTLLFFCQYSVSLGDALTTAAVWPFLEVRIILFKSICCFLKFVFLLYLT